MVTCQFCNAVNLEGAKFCSSCGKEISTDNASPNQSNYRFCVACGRSINWTAKACPNCGCDLQRAAKFSKVRGGLTRSNLTGGTLLIVVGVITFLTSLIVISEILTDWNSIVNRGYYYYSDYSQSVANTLYLCAFLSLSIAGASVFTVLGGILTLTRNNYELSVLGGVLSLYSIGYFISYPLFNWPYQISSFGFVMVIDLIMFFIGLTALIIVINLRDDFKPRKKLRRQEKPASDLPKSPSN